MLRAVILIIVMLSFVILCVMVLACTIKTLRIRYVQVPKKASVFFQDSVFVSEDRKDTSLAFSVNYQSVMLYSTGNQLELLY
jgi:hypothetical protein